MRLALLALGALLRKQQGRLGLGVERTVAPFDMDASFLPRLNAEPQDVLLLFYSPTCPDCQWFLSRWAALAADMRTTPVSLWTVADPGFIAPDPYTHWHNPAILFAPAGNRSHPVPFGESTLNLYLQGDARPQAAQDREFRQMLLNFVADHATSALTYVPPTDDAPQAKLNKLAESAWKLLQKRWDAADASANLSGGGKPVVLASSATELTKKYVATYEQAHPGMTQTARAYIEEYYRKYFEKHVADKSG